jgi:2'-5' RNA ligase
MAPNWFLAFPLDGSFVAELPPPPPGFQLFHPEDVHLTLAFFGGCGEAAAHRGLHAVQDELRERPRPPLAVSLADVVPMGPRRQYSALSALLAEGRAEAEARILRWRDVASAAAVGAVESRAPKAHVTVAKPLRRATLEERQSGLRWAEGLDLRNVTASLDRLSLYTWSEGDRRQRLFRIVREQRLPT